MSCSPPYARCRLRLRGKSLRRATGVSEKPEDELELELKGAIAGLDRAAATFAIGALTVDFSEAVIENAPPGGLREGLFVEVEGAEPPVDDVLQAAGVEIPPPLGEAGDGLDVEGFVSEIVSADEFVLNTAQRVRITPETRFEGGTRADLVPNASVDVEGSVADDGTLVAREIEIAR